MTDLLWLRNILFALFTRLKPMATYYHVALVDYEPGAVIQPGRTGAFYKRYVQGGNIAPQNPKEAYQLTWEAALETARRLIDPALPSRLNCVYACTTQKAAEQFRDKYRPGASIFMVKVSPSTPTFVGDLDGISNTKAGEAFLDTWVETSIRYWTVQHNAATEILIGGPATVIGKV